MGETVREFSVVIVEDGRYGDPIDESMRMSGRDVCLDNGFMVLGKRVVVLLDVYTDSQPPWLRVMLKECNVGYPMSLIDVPPFRAYSMMIESLCGALYIENVSCEGKRCDEVVPRLPRLGRIDGEFEFSEDIARALWKVLRPGDEIETRLRLVGADLYELSIRISGGGEPITLRLLLRSLDPHPELLVDALCRALRERLRLVVRNHAVQNLARALGLSPSDLEAAGALPPWWIVASFPLFERGQMNVGFIDVPEPTMRTSFVARLPSIEVVGTVSLNPKEVRIQLEFRDHERGVLAKLLQQAKGIAYFVEMMREEMLRRLGLNPEEVRSVTLLLTEETYAGEYDEPKSISLRKALDLVQSGGRVFVTMYARARDGSDWDSFAYTIAELQLSGSTSLLGRTEGRLSERRLLA